MEHCFAGSCAPLPSKQLKISSSVLKLITDNKVHDTWATLSEERYSIIIMMIRGQQMKLFQPASQSGAVKSEQ